MDHSAGPGPAQTPPEDSLSDLPSEGAPVAHGLLARLAYGLGGLGLLGATAADSIAVAGRHTGLHLLGSIELVQTAVVLLGASAMLIATIVGGHASVHIVTERLPRPTAARLARACAFVSGLVFLVLAAGSIWVASDLWHGFEQTELLHIPLRWLRLVWIAFALLIAVTFFRHALRKPA
ncbi:MAG: TRAP transporter small permease subunit [Novosphingobium sp.]|nr:MAG: TRAP transporter small permease subunit [Novosphingobium sp.]